MLATVILLILGTEVVDASTAVFLVLSCMNSVNLYTACRLHVLDVRLRNHRP